MKSTMKAVCFALAVFVAGLTAGCGSGGGGTTVASNATSPNPPSAASTDAAALYAANCANCHGALDVSTKKGITIARLQNAIANNTGGMGSLSALTAAEQQTIVSGLTPAAPTPAPTPTPTPTTDGAALYAANCAGCHGPLATSSKKGATAAQIQSRMDAPPFASRALTSAEVQSIAEALVVTTPTPTPAPTPAPTPTLDGAALYATNCANCHGALASSGKKGITLVRLQNAITGNTGNMGFLSTLTTAQEQAIVTALAPPTPTPTPTPTPAPVTDGATLYANNCAGCHGALASSAKAGATAARTQTAINNNVGGMGSLSSLTATQVAAIATSLAVVTPSPTPAPTPSCGSCHAIPPAVGEHSAHRSRTCATCHGTGYSTTTVNATTHNNGAKNLATTIGWNSTTRSCSNSCHGSRSW